MTKAFNKTSEKIKRRILRSNMPKAEAILWAKLRNKRLKDYKFRRQYSVENFVIDFYCPKLKLAIELDGDSHFVEGAGERDRDRQRVIELYGITFLRFTNLDIYKNIEAVLERVTEYMLKPPPPESPPPAPSLVRRGERKTMLGKGEERRK